MDPHSAMERIKREQDLRADEMRNGGLKRHQEKLRREVHASRGQTITWLVILLVILVLIGLLVFLH